MLQEEQPEDDEEGPLSQGFASPLKPQTESFFRTSSDPHLEQVIFVEPKTSFSNSAPHLPHLYS